MSYMPQKTVYFYRINRKRRDSAAFVLETNKYDWCKVLDEYSKLPAKDRTQEGRVFFINKIRENTILTITEKIDNRFFVQLDKESGEPHDLVLEALNKGDLRIGQVALLLFYRDMNVVAYTAAVPKKPSKKIVENFLNENFSDNGFDWVLEPLWTPDGYDEFSRNIPGIYKVSSSFSTQRDLFAKNDEDNDGIVAFANRLSDRLGTDLNIKLTISLSKRDRRKGAEAKFKRIVDDLIRVGIHSDRTVSVNFEDAYNVLNELNLQVYLLCQELFWQ